ncbi:histidine--tRNA ligase [Patescibacteria group bacterium]|nr:histidine--tRNA ligase [Patescibacteria group bacterium]MBU4511867.1 histidine--tRNA ligase [Patescibacteria group bacterium]
MSRKKKQSKKAKENRKVKGALKQAPQLLRGMKDILPQEQKYWELIRSKVEKLAPVYGFGKIDTPLLEETRLFERAVGEGTDIVEKEMFSFTDQGGDNISLRPEATASIVRAYTEHGMLNLPQPVKLWYWGPMFRYDRPQAGRLRQFNQFGFEVLGSLDSVVDAQLILIFYKLCQELKLDATVQINSIGCPECRDEYQKILVDFFRTKKNFLCDTCRIRLTKNPLRILDCKEEECKALSAEAPQIIDFLCEECKEHFIKVLEHLDELEIPYNLNSRLVRGLDYYTKTVFEIWPTFAPDGASAGKPTLAPVETGTSADEAALSENVASDTKQTKETKAANPQKSDGDKDSETEMDTDKVADDPGRLALGGGGRYDDLVEMLGGRPTPAVGFSCGIERLILCLKKQGGQVRTGRKVDIFVAQLGDQAKKRSLKLFEDLRCKGVKVAENLAKEGLKSQLEIANKLGVKYSLILGQKEMLDKTIIIRDMESGVQEVVDFDKVLVEIKKRLK